MESVPIAKIVGLLIMIVMSAFFSSAETSLSVSSRIRIQSLADRGNKKAKIVIRILDKYSQAISTILVGNNIVNISASAIATVLAIEIGMSISLMTGVLTIVLLLFGEILPKNLAKIKAEPLALFYSSVINLLMLLMSPIVFITSTIEKLILKILGLDSNEKPVMTEAELRAYVELSHDDSVIESDEKEIINKVIDFGDKVAKEIMIPRIDMESISIDASYEDVRELYKENMFTRTPVYKDSSDNIVGTLNIKDFVLVNDRDNFKLEDIMRKPSYTHEHRKLKDILAQMRQDNINIIYVIDEYGQTSGMLTLEDLLSEIVGDLKDEYDAVDTKIQKIDDSSYLIEGSTNLNEVSDALGVDVSCEEYSSLGGLIIHKLDSIPDNGAVVEIDNIKYTVKEVNNNRVGSVLVEFIDNTEVVGA